MKWCGEVDLNGFPAKPALQVSNNAPKPNNENAEILKTAPPKFSLCAACHSVGGSGGNIGPALDGIITRMDAATIFKKIKDPKSVLPDSKMAQLGLPDNEIQELVTFLEKLK